VVRLADVAGRCGWLLWLAGWRRDDDAAAVTVVAAAV